MNHRQVQMKYKKGVISVEVHERKKKTGNEEFPI